MLKWPRLVAVMFGVGLVAVALGWIDQQIRSTKLPATVSRPSEPPIATSADPIAIADRVTGRIHWIRSNGHNQGAQAIPEERRMYLFTQADVDRAIDEEGFRWGK